MWSHHATETVRNIVSACKKLAQRKYRQRHDRVALRVHWEMCRKYGIECNDKWYDNQPLPTAENGEVRITWDTTIDTDKVLKHNWPDITLVHKDTEMYTYWHSCASGPEHPQSWRGEGWKIPGTSIWNQKESWRLESHNNTAIGIGALGSISKGAKTWFGKRDVPDFLGSVQLSGTAHLLRKVKGVVSKETSAALVHRWGSSIQEAPWILPNRHP